MEAASEYTNQDYTQADAHWEDIMSSITDLDVPFPDWEQYQPQHEQLKEDLLDVQMLMKAAAKDLAPIKQQEQSAVR